MTPRELVIRWRTDAETAARYGGAGIAETLRACADDLERSLASAEDETLSLAEAALESGYSPDRLRHLVAEGEIPNAGRKGSPLIRRGDLPKKRGRSSATFDAAALAADVLNKRKAS